jgi:hypothetical protein
MRNIFFITALILAMALLSSCKRDWVCTCTYPGQAYQGVVQLQINRTTQADAQAQCNQDAILQDTFTLKQTLGTATGAWNCSL